MLEFNNLRSVVDDYGREYVEKLKEALVRDNRVASGNLVNSLSYEVEFDGEKITLWLNHIDYLRFPNTKRNPTVNAGDGRVRLKLLEWARLKGLTPKGNQTLEQLSYALANKIHSQGYEGRDKSTNIPYTQLVEQLLYPKYHQLIENALMDDFMADAAELELQLVEKILNA